MPHQIDITENFIRYRQIEPDLISKKTFRNVPLSHAHYEGKEFQKWNKKGTRARAIVGKLKSSKQNVIQSILIPRD